MLTYILFNIILIILQQYLFIQLTFNNPLRTFLLHY